jgi:membrane associated rhomboid family serine protease
MLQIMSPDPDLFVRTYGFISENFMKSVPGSVFTIFSSMWLHGGILHVVSNLWFLHIFGDNVEDRLGHIRYLGFYIVAGVAALLVQYLFNPTSAVPLIGASGAIAGVTGAYFVIFKHSEILALVPTFFGIWQRVKLPAWFFLGYWFVLQVFSGVGSFASMSADGGGVAFFAHIGGFVFGYLVALLFYKPRPVEIHEKLDPRLN